MSDQRGNNFNFSAATCWLSVKSNICLTCSHITLHVCAYVFVCMYVYVYLKCLSSMAAAQPSVALCCWCWHLLICLSNGCIVIKIYCPMLLFYCCCLFLENCTIVQKQWRNIQIRQKYCWKTLNKQRCSARSCVSFGISSTCCSCGICRALK